MPLPIQHKKLDLFVLVGLAGRPRARPLAVMHGHAVAPLDAAVEATGGATRLIRCAAWAVGVGVHAAALAPAALLAISKLYGMGCDNRVEQRRAADVLWARPAARRDEALLNRLGDDLVDELLHVRAQ